MCGICGVAGGDPTVARELVELMCAAMAHRGPDDAGVAQLGEVTLGMRRLSIIDLEHGHQPMCNEDSTVWVVQNGEIYNHLELRKQLIAAGHDFRTSSDTEVLVHGYEEWGEAMLERLNGMFAFAAFDRRAGQLFLARDRMGIKPLYFAHDPTGRLIFASELKALLREPTLRRGVNLVALDQYLAFDFVPSPATIVRKAYKLPPAGTLMATLAEKRSVLGHFWDHSLNLDGRPRGVDAEASRLLDVLRESVRKELISDVPLGVFLSGGIDSSAVAAMMAQLGSDVKTFSVGFAERSFDESVYAREVARHLGTEHHELKIEAGEMLRLIPTLGSLLDEPFGDASIIPTYLLSKFTREHVKVALGGDGGDELFAGYPTLQAHRLAAYYSRLPRPLRRGLIEPLVHRLPVSRDNLSFDFRAKRFVDGAAQPVAERHLGWMGSFGPRARSAVLAEAVDGDPEEMVREQFPTLDPLNQVLMLDMRYYLEGDILVKLDRASMMASLEARVPLLNNDLVAYATALPLNLKLRGLRSKYLLKRALRGVLPARILERPKKGFGIPVADWFRGPLREQMVSALSPERMGRDGFFDPAAVSALVDGHLRGVQDNRKQLWTLFAFQMWHEGYRKLAG